MSANEAVKTAEAAPAKEVTKDAEVVQDAADKGAEKAKMGKVRLARSRGEEAVGHDTHMAQLMGLLNKISPKMARKIAEKGAKKAGVSTTQATAVGKTVEQVVEKQQAAGTAPAH